MDFVKFAQFAQFALKVRHTLLNLSSDNEKAMLAPNAGAALAVVYPQSWGRLAIRDARKRERQSGLRAAASRLALSQPCRLM